MESHRSAYEYPPPHETMRNYPYGPIHHHHHESPRWRYSPSYAGNDRSPYSFSSEYPASAKRPFAEYHSDGSSIPVLSPKRPKHFWPESADVNVKERELARREPREWPEDRVPSGPTYYREYSRSPSGSYPPTTRRPEEHDRLRREISKSYSDEKVAGHHTHAQSYYAGYDRYYPYEMTSPRRHYHPELHRSNVIPKSPIPYTEKKSPVYNYNDANRSAERNPPDEEKKLRSEYHDAKPAPKSPTSVNRYVGLSFKRQAHEGMHQGRDDQETLLRTTSNCSDGSRERYDAYESAREHEDSAHRARYMHSVPHVRTPVAYGQWDGRHSVPLHPSSRHGTPRNSPDGAPPSLEIGWRRNHEKVPKVPGEEQQEGRPVHVTPHTTKKVFCSATAPSEPPVERLLLALPEDKTALSKALCIIRENVEVFRATPRDVDAPAPGRKNPVVVGQVGLRCIHCRHLSDRVKRAVCYPSSLRRIYRTITDMKLDHFTACSGVPQEIKDVLDKLKVVSSRSTGTTMRYFVDSAMKLGLVDAENGVRFKSDVPINKSSEAGGTSPSGYLTVPSQSNDSAENCECSDSKPPAVASPQANFAKMKSLLSTSSKLLGDQEGQDCTSDVQVVRKCSESDAEGDEHDEASPTSVPSHSNSDPLVDVVSAEITPGSSNDLPCDQEQPIFRGCVLLNQKEDQFMLSPLRCFLRENVYAFSATEEDIAARTPTNFSVVLGQVGICCMHCYRLPPKDRINRAVCFPFSIDRLYQSVADLQRFHFSICTEVPDDVKEKFASLKSASSKGSKGLATRQYWVTSAKKLGLVDSPVGIKFGRDPHAVTAPAISLDILAQVAVDLTAQRPLALPEDRHAIAEFLYYVMMQLQPCRFTEADRNKRRMKEVGCIGVECKHCVGQADSRKFFWSSVNAVESNFISVHTHLTECRFVPQEVKDRLVELKGLRKEQTSKLKSGSQKAFFARVWKRLHEYAGIELSPSYSSESLMGSSNSNQE